MEVPLIFWEALTLLIYVTAFVILFPTFIFVILLVIGIASETFGYIQRLFW